MARIRPAKFAHVVYRTRRFAQMVQWYQRVFDAKIQFQNEMLAFLTYDDEHHRIAFANLSILDPEGAAVERRGKIGVDHVAYTFRSLRELFENYEQLKSDGITPYWCIHHGVTVSLYYADPDGNQMEFQIDSYPTNEEANAYMYGPNYKANAMGVEYNPDEWLARLRAGTPESAFLIRTVDEPISPYRGSLVD